MGFLRLLKDIKTGLYYTSSGGWTEDTGKAWNFPDTMAAVQTAMTLDKQNLHLVLKFPDSRMDVSHSLSRITQDSSSGGSAGPTEMLLFALLPAASVAGPLFRRIAG